MLYPWWGCQINWKPQTIQSSNIQSNCICNKYTYICRTTQRHTITTQPQYRTYTSPYIPNAHSTVAILVQAFLRSIVGPPSCRRSAVDPPGCRLSAMAREDLEAVGRLLEAWRGGELDDDAALAAIRSRVQRPDRREPSPARQALRAFRRQIAKVVNRINWLFLKVFVYESGQVRDVFLQQLYTAMRGCYVELRHIRLGYLPTDPHVRITEIRRYITRIEDVARMSGLPRVDLSGP